MTITFPQADVDAFFKQTGRLESELGRTHKASIRTAAKFVLISAGAITKKSQQYRKYKRIGKKNKTGMGLFEVDISSAGKGLMQAAQKSGLAHGTDKVRIPAASVKELKKSGFVKIGARGLAKVSWQMIASRGRIGSVMAGKSTPPSHALKKMARDKVKWTERFSSSEQYVRLENDLQYIEKAITGGRSAMDGIMGKAARNMERDINIKLEQKAKAI
jgi:hypothetical protein